MVASARGGAGLGTEVTFGVEAEFEVRLDAGYKYQPFATLVGEQFTPRLVVFDPNGERLGALPASAPYDGAGCSQLASSPRNSANL